MAQRTHPNGTRLGTAIDAAALCVTDRSPDGVSVSTYRYYTGKLGAPGPYVDPETGCKSHSPTTGELEYDLDEVERWNRNRPGPGSYWSDIEHRTAVRHDVLGAVGAGEVAPRIGEATGGDQRGRLSVELQRRGKPFGGRVIMRAFNDMRRAGLLDVPATGGPVVLTDAGRELLGRWDVEAKEQKKAARAKAKARTVNVS